MPYNSLCHKFLRFFIDIAAEASRQQLPLNEAINLLIRSAFGFLAVAALGNQILTASATYVASDVGWSATNKVRSDVAEHCLKLDMSFHNARRRGAYRAH
ncbi:MAG: hypothetical protein R2865_14825 [Deinococcales bacterium]